MGFGRLHDWSCGTKGDLECCVCRAWAAGYRTPPVEPLFSHCPGPDPGPEHTYVFISDPGHGWLEVPIDHLIWLNIHMNITSFSYIRGEMAYLEEDCDYMTFRDAAIKAGWDIAINEKYDEAGSIRHFLPYVI